MAFPLWSSLCNVASGKMQPPPHTHTPMRKRRRKPLSSTSRYRGRADMPAMGILVNSRKSGVCTSSVVVPWGGREGEEKGKETNKKDKEGGKNKKQPKNR